MRGSIVIFFISSLIFLQSCTKYRNEDLISSSTTEIKECSLNSEITVGQKCIVKNGNYIYNNPFGGRDTEQDSQYGPDGSLTFPIPTGWYEGRTATVYDSDLQAANVALGFSIFGIQGTLTGAAYPSCNAGVIDSHVGNPSTCALNAGNYVYLNDYGGRTEICPASGLITTQCWISGAGKYLNSNLVPTCTTEGLVNSKCKVPATDYWYTTPFGGRGNQCVIPGTAAADCWTNQNNIYAYNQTCVDGYNGEACLAQANRYVYTTAYGGRNVDCTNNNVGSCYFTAAKNVIEPNLTASNIKSTSTIYGVTGSYTGSSLSWGSGMNRDKSATKLTTTAETTTYAGTNTLPAGYRAIPKIDTDTDGAVLNGTPQVTVVDRSAWGAMTCGLSGTLAARISNCNKTWTGDTSANAGQGVWQLVTRTAVGKEVWKDASTGLIWSSLVSTGINWCKGIGSNNSANVNIVNQNLAEDDPNNICDQIFYQNQLATDNVVSACAEFVGTTTTDSNIDNSGKSNLNAASSPSVRWRVPTMYDYMLANHNGLRFVLPDMQVGSLGTEWTSTVYSVDRSKAFAFDAATGQRSVQSRSFLNNIRCVGR